jgi:uncharacterized membrane protein HdeD (DUF308 family)
VPKNLAFLDRGLFLVILGVLWVLYEQGSIATIVQLVGTLLVVFGISVVLVSIFAMVAKEEVSV